MKIGFNLLLWTGHVTEENYPTIEKLKAAGYDGVELPIFDVSNPAHFASVGRVLKDNGLECTAVTVLPDEAHNAISAVAANRQGAIDHLKRVLECAHNAGVHASCAPLMRLATGSRLLFFSGPLGRPCRGHAMQIWPVGSRAGCAPAAAAHRPAAGTGPDDTAGFAPSSCPQSLARPLVGLMDLLRPFPFLFLALFLASVTPRGSV